jgi:ubiquinone biosynthesis protein COQ4
MQNIVGLNAASHASSIGRYRLRPFEALRAFRRLANDRDDTLQAFLVIRALSGASIAKGYQRLLADGEGARQAYRAIELSSRLDDNTWLKQFGPNTVGGCYREFVAQRHISANGLADESRKLREPDIDAAHPIAWYARRLRDIHDIFHVLTGYGTDALGEACLVAFTAAQTGNLGLTFLALAAAFELKRDQPRYPYFKAVWQAWRNGRRAEWLPALDFERLFAKPLVFAQSDLNIVQPKIYLSVPMEACNPRAIGGPAGTKTSQRLTTEVLLACGSRNGPG